MNRFESVSGFFALASKMNMYRINEKVQIHKKIFIVIVFVLYILTKTKW